MTTTRTRNPALARSRQLAQRPAFDLRFAHDAAQAAGVPYTERMRLRRAHNEVRDLLRALEGATPQRLTLEDALVEVEAEQQSQSNRHVRHPF